MQSRIAALTRLRFQRNRWLDDCREHISDADEDGLVDADFAGVVGNRPWETRASAIAAAVRPPM